MAKKVPLDKLSDEIENILDDYKNDINQGVRDAVVSVTKAGAKAVKAEARSKFKSHTGLYAKGWTYKVERKDKLTTQGVIYNKDIPGLPHLLENGHAKRGGGRVPGRQHIKPVEDLIVKEFEAKVVRAI